MFPFQGPSSKALHVSSAQHHAMFCSVSSFRVPSSKERSVFKPGAGAPLVSCCSCLKLTFCICMLNVWKSSQAKEQKKAKKSVLGAKFEK